MYTVKKLFPCHEPDLLIIDDVNGLTVGMYDRDKKAFIESYGDEEKIKQAVEKYIADEQFINYLPGNKHTCLYGATLHRYLNTEDFLTAVANDEQCSTDLEGFKYALQIKDLTNEQIDAHYLIEATLKANKEN